MDQDQIILIITSRVLLSKNCAMKFSRPSRGKLPKWMVNGQYWDLMKKKKRFSRSAFKEHYSDCSFFY